MITKSRLKLASTTKLIRETGDLSEHISPTLKQSKRSFIDRIIATNETCTNSDITGVKPPLMNMKSARVLTVKKNSLKMKPTSSQTSLISKLNDRVLTHTHSPNKLVN